MTNLGFEASRVGVEGSPAAFEGRSSLNRFFSSHYVVTLADIEHEKRRIATPIFEAQGIYAAEEYSKLIQDKLAFLEANPGVAPWPVDAIQAAPRSTPPSWRPL